MRLRGCSESGAERDGTNTEHPVWQCLAGSAPGKARVTATLEHVLVAFTWKPMGRLDIASQILSFKSYGVYSVDDNWRQKSQIWYLTVADPRAGSYEKHNSETYPVNKCHTFAIHSKENKRAESWERHAHFTIKWRNQTGQISHKQAPTKYTIPIAKTGF